MHRLYGVVIRSDIRAREDFIITPKIRKRDRARNARDTVRLKIYGKSLTVRGKSVLRFLRIRVPG